jgi:diguanylate cyclase (GGDEF)-like protein/PAS domain S-box-containing protein
LKPKATSPILWILAYGLITLLLGAVVVYYRLPEALLVILAGPPFAAATLSPRWVSRAMAWILALVSGVAILLVSSSIPFALLVFLTVLVSMVATQAAIFRYERRMVVWADQKTIPYREQAAQFERRSVELERALHNTRKETLKRMEAEAAGHQQAKAALFESEVRFRALFENCPDGIFFINAETMRIIDCNDHAARMNGSTRDELIGQPVYALFPDIDDPASLDNRFFSLKDLRTQPMRVERSHHLNDGSSTAIETAMSLMKIGGSETILAIDRDITERKRLEIALKENEVQFRSLFDQSPVGIIMYDSDGRLTRINLAAMINFGVNSQDEIRGYNLFDLPNMTNDIHDRLNRGDFVRFEVEYNFEQIQEKGIFPTHRADVAFLDIALSPLKHTGVVNGYMAYVNDVTTRRRSQQAEQEMIRLSEALRDVASALNSTLLIDEVLDLILSRIAEILPHDALTVMLIEDGAVHIERFRGFTGHGAGDIQPNWTAPVAQVPVLQQVIDAGSWIIHTHAAYETGWFGYAPDADWVHSAIYAPLRSRNEVIGLLSVVSATPGFFTPVQAQRLQAFADQAASAIANARLYNEIQHLASHDELTRLYNRRALFEMGRHEVDRSRRFKRPMSILFIDIDHFKLFNDRYSYAIGDRVLRFIAAQLRSGLRDVDILARYGGEEFIVMLTECDLPEAMDVAERLRAKIEASRVQTEMGDLSVTISVGVARIRLEPGMTDKLTGSDQKTLEELITRANTALHRAKEGGRNRVEVAPDIPRFPPETVAV